MRPRPRRFMGRAGDTKRTRRRAPRTTSRRRRRPIRGAWVAHAAAPCGMPREPKGQGAAGEMSKPRRRPRPKRPSLCGGPAHGACGRHRKDKARVGLECHAQHSHAALLGATPCHGARRMRCATCRRDGDKIDNPLLRPRSLSWARGHRGECNLSKDAMDQVYGMASITLFRNLINRIRDDHTA